jgi:arylsulfatase A-like enzyme
MACYGNDLVEAPNLNRLASRSFVFERAYCCQPVCTPSRGCILTGQWPHQHGARGNNQPLRRDVATFAEMIDPSYRRAYHGKWHLGDEITAQHGFEEWVSIEDGMYRRYYSDPSSLERRSDYHHFLYGHGYCPDQRTADGAAVFSRALSAAMPYRFTKAGFLARSASRVLLEHDRSRPFALSVNFLEPHMPFFGPLNDRYDPGAIPVGPAFGRKPDERASLRHRAMASWYEQTGFENRPLRSEDDWRRFRANYLALVTQVDTAVGQILDALEQAGLADNTIVVFTSDHGEMMGDHALLAKGVMYEEAVHIPLLMRVPWLCREQRRIGGSISQIDLAPTLLDLMNQPIPNTLMGRSRRDVLEGRATLEENDVFFLWSGDEYNPNTATLAGVSQEQLDAVARQEWRSIISAEGWKLNLCATDPNCELYHLRDDPCELHNRFDDPSCRSLVRELTQRIGAWQQRTGDEEPLAR